MEKRKTKAIVAGVMGTTMTMMLAGCGTSTTSMPPKPTDTNCNDWDYDAETGTYQCDDSRSSYRGHYYHGGSYYSTSSGLMASNAYKSGVANGSITPKSGFGSGSKGGSFGG